MNKKNLKVNKVYPSMVYRALHLWSKRVLFICKILCFALVLIVTFTHYLSDFRSEVKALFYDFTSKVGFKTQNIIIEGQINIPMNHILMAIDSNKGSPIFSVSLSDICRKLSKNSWIKVVAVGRRLPYTLYISLIERDPIAIWQYNQKLVLIDDSGYTIEVPDVSQFGNLIHVVGPDANMHAKALLIDLEIYPNLKKEITFAIRYGERRWDLVLQNTTVKMPEQKFKDALRYLARMYDSGLLREYKTIDLRDNEKFYIEQYFSQ